jgi:hypothetical protein
VEHPKPRQKLAVENFHMTIDGKVSFPTVEVIHEKTPEPRTEAAIFMTGLLESVLNMGEQLMAFLADTNVQPAWHGISVVEFPPSSSEPSRQVLLRDEHERRHDTYRVMA